MWYRLRIHPPALKREAVEITGSERDPDTAENAINVYKGSADVCVVPYLSAASGGSDTAWFLIAEGHKLRIWYAYIVEYPSRGSS